MIQLQCNFGEKRGFIKMKIDILENILIVCGVLFLLNTYVGLWLMPIISVPIELLILIIAIGSLFINYSHKSYKKQAK